MDKKENLGINGRWLALQVDGLNDIKAEEYKIIIVIKEYSVG